MSSIPQAVPQQLKPSVAYENTISGKPWNLQSVREVSPISLGSNQTIDFQLNHIGKFISLKGCTVDFNIRFTGTTAAKVKYDAAMMFKDITFNSGDSRPVDSRNVNMAYVAGKMKKSDDFLASSATAYAGITAVDSTENSANSIPVSVPLNLFSGWFENPLYYVGKTTTVSFTTDDLTKCINGGTPTLIYLENVVFNYKVIDVPSDVREGMLSAMATSGNTFMYDSYDVQLMTANGSSAIQFTNSSTSVQHVVIIGTADDDTPLNYYEPLPVTIKPNSVALICNGTKANQDNITTSKQHLSSVIEAFNLDDQMIGCNSQLISGITGNRAVNDRVYGGLFAWEIGLERVGDPRIRTGFNPTIRNNMFTVDFNVSKPGGTASTSGYSIALIMATQSVCVQTPNSVSVIV